MPLNEKKFIDRYNSTTGAFTVPTDGDGFYYFSVYLQVEEGQLGHFDLEMNGQVLCTAHADQQETTGDEGQAACSATTDATAGRSLHNDCLSSLLVTVESFHYIIFSNR